MPSLGYVAPDRKPFKLNVPIDEELKNRIDAAASAKGITKTALARRLLSDGLERMGL